MKQKNTTSFNDLLSDLQERTGYRKAERKIKPIYEIALAIIKRRHELGLTQSQLAEKANTHQSRIAKIESSELDIRLSTLVDIAEALDSQIEIQFLPNSDFIIIGDKWITLQIFPKTAYSTTAIPIHEMKDQPFEPIYRTK